MSTAITALIDALLGLVAIWAGLRFHVGSWFLDGPWAYVASAVSCALVALVIRSAMRKQSAGREN